VVDSRCSYWQRDPKEVAIAVELGASSGMVTGTTAAVGKAVDFVVIA